MKSCNEIDSYFFGLKWLSEIYQHYYDKWACTLFVWDGGSIRSRNNSNLIPVGIVGVASSPTDTYVLYRKGKERKGKRICLTISWVADCIAILFFYYYLLIYLKPNFCFGADELTLWNERYFSRSINVNMFHWKTRKVPGLFCCVLD